MRKQLGLIAIVWALSVSAAAAEEAVAERLARVETVLAATCPLLPDEAAQRDAAERATSQGLEAGGALITGAPPGTQTFDVTLGGESLAPTFARAKMGFAS